MRMRYGQLRTLRVRYGPITDRTNRYGRVIRSIRKIRICVCDLGLDYNAIITLQDFTLLNYLNFVDIFRYSTHPGIAATEEN